MLSRFACSGTSFLSIERPRTEGGWALDRSGNGPRRNTRRRTAPEPRTFRQFGLFLLAILLATPSVSSGGEKRNDGPDHPETCHHSNGHAERGHEAKGVECRAAEAKDKKGSVALEILAIALPGLREIGFQKVIEEPTRLPRSLIDWGVLGTEMYCDDQKRHLHSCTLPVRKRSLHIFSWVLVKVSILDLRNTEG